jgi:hypothetical protein
VPRHFHPFDLRTFEKRTLGHVSMQEKEHGDCFKSLSLLLVQFGEILRGDLFYNFVL